MANIVNWNPRQVRRALRQMQPWGGDLSRWMEQMEEEFGELAPWTQGKPVLDMYETDTAIVVEADLPGVKADEVDISVRGDLLTIRGETEDEAAETRGDYHYRERRYGEFERTVALPVDVLAEEAEAKFEDGILKLVMPKVEEERSKSVSIKVKEEKEAAK